MPIQEPISPIELKGWVGGLNRQADPYQLEETEVPDCINVDFGLRGSVSKRRGYTEYSSATAQSFFIFEWDGTIIHVFSTQVNYLVGTTTTDTSTDDFAAASSARDYAIVAASMNDKIYLTSVRASASGPITYDGTTWSNIANSDFDGSSGVFPRARALVAAHERIFALNVRTDGGTDYKSRMYWSNPLDAETWDALDWIDIAPDDGTEITGAVLFGEQIVIFKERSMFVLAGTDEDTFTLYPIDSALGTHCPGTITNVGPELYFFDHLTGVHSFDGSGFKRRDDKINTYLLDGVNESVIYKAVGFAYRGRWFLSVPWGAATENSRTFVYDPRIDAWTEYDYGFADAVIDGTTPLAVGVNSTDGVFHMFTGQDDNGSDIAAYVRTGWLAPTTPSVKHRIRRLDLTMSAKGDYDITVNMRRDFAQDTYKSKTINTNPGGALYGTAVYGVDAYGIGSDQVLSRTTGWGDRWRVCQFEFREDAQGDFQVNRMVMQTSSLRRTRGAH